MRYAVYEHLSFMHSKKTIKQNLVLNIGRSNLKECLKTRRKKGRRWQIARTRNMHDFDPCM